MIRKSNLTLAVTLLGFTAGSTVADVIVDEDFEGATSFADTVFSGERVDNGTGVSATLETDSTTFPSNGAGNTFVNLTTTTDNFAAVGVNDDFSELDNGIFSASFMFNEPVQATPGGEARFYIGGNTGDRPVWLNFQDGVISPEDSADTFAYVPGTAYTLDVVANESGSTITYDSGSETLANNSYDVYLSGPTGPAAQIFDDVAFQETGVLIDSFYFVSADGNQSFTFDDIIITDDEAVIRGGSNVIPEPASLALLGLGGLMMLGRRRSA